MFTCKATPLSAALAILLNFGLIAPGSAFAQRYGGQHFTAPQPLQYQRYVPEYVQPNAGATPMWPNRVVPVQPGVQQGWFPPRAYAPQPYLDPRNPPTFQPVPMQPRFIWRIYR